MTDHDLTRTEGEGLTLDMPEELSAFAPGQEQGERYQILEMLGRGGMGEVWHAFDLKLRVEVALKALREDLFKSENRRELLRREVRAAREVMSPNVCRIFDLVEVNGRELVSMEYIDGATLLAVLQERGPLELMEAQDIASQFLAGLEAIHQAGLVHRDIKPENIMLTRAGRVVVMDFGLARQDTEGGGSVSGTPAYMSPEQSEGETLDARADVYSAGVVLAEMVSPEGIKSFESRQSLWESVRSEPAKVPDSPWAPVLKRAVAKDREGRYHTAHTLTRALEDVTLRVEGAEDLHPYPGLASFTEQDAEYFFGREAEVEQMWRKLDRPHLLALVGPSGAGKTSFLRAGLIPSAGPSWGILRCTPGNTPFLSVGQALAKEMAGDAEAMEILAQGHEPDTLVSVFARWKERHDHALLIADQFEELFTHSSAEEQNRFTELMKRLAIEADVFVLLSMRDDFLLRCREHEALAPVFTDLTALLPPTGGALRRAVVQPATRCGYRFEDDDLVQEILAEVEGERGALPLLAFALARLWDERDREAGLLTREAYHDVGGVGGALAQHAEATVDRIGTQRIAIVRELFRNLVTAEGTRAVREWDELLSVFDGDQTRDSNVGEGFIPSPTAAEEVLRELIDSRLLTSYEIKEEDREPTRRVEIIHESLLANWPRLVRWQTQDADAAQLRDQLRQAARTWDEHDRNDDLLWTGSAYREFQLWRERYPGGLTEIEEAFAAAMTSLATRRKRRRRIAAAAALIVAVVVASVFGVLWRRSVRETLRAEAQKLLALAQLEVDVDPTAALAWARASLEISDTIEGRLFALRALAKGPVARLLSSADGGIHGFERSDFSSDGEWASFGGFGTASIMHRSGGTAVATGNHLFGQVAFAASGRQIGVCFDDEILIYSVPGFAEVDRYQLPSPPRRCMPWDDGFVILYNTENETQIDLWQFGSRPEPVTKTPIFKPWSWDHAARWLVYAPTRENHRIYLQSLTDPGHPPRLVHVSDEAIFDISLHPELDWIAVKGSPFSTALWPLDAAVSAPLRSIESDGLYRLRVDRPGKRIITAGLLEGIPTASVWDLDAPVNAKPVVLRSRTRGEVFRINVDPSGRWVVGTNLRAALFWPLHGNPPLVLPGDGSQTYNLAFTPDGRSLVIPSRGGGRVQPIGGGRLVLQLTEDRGTWGVAMDPQGQFAVITGWDDEWGMIWPLDGSEPTELEAMGGGSVAYDPDRNLVAVGEFGGSPTSKVIKILDLRDGSKQVLGPIEDAGETKWGGFANIEFMPDGSLLTATRGVGIQRWWPEDGSAELLFAANCGAMVLTPDGQSAIVLLYEEKLGNSNAVIVDLTTGEGRSVEGLQGSFSGVAFAHRDDVIAVASENGDVQIKRLSGGEPYILYGHETSVYGLAFSQDDSLIAAVDQRGTVRVWPVPDLTRPPIQTMPYDVADGQARHPHQPPRRARRRVLHRLVGRDRPVPGLGRGAGVVMNLVLHPEPRSGDRYLAWGVSPRYRANIKGKAPEGRQIYAVRWGHTTPGCAGGTPAPQRPRPDCGAGVSPAHFGHWGELPR